MKAGIKPATANNKTGKYITGIMHLQVYAAESYCKDEYNKKYSRNDFYIIGNGGL